jgi:hypothetical protein
VIRRRTQPVQRAKVGPVVLIPAARLSTADGQCPQVAPVLQRAVVRPTSRGWDQPKCLGSMQSSLPPKRKEVASGAVPPPVSMRCSTGCPSLPARGAHCPHVDTGQITCSCLRANCRTPVYSLLIHLTSCPAPGKVHVGIRPSADGNHSRQT